MKGINYLLKYIKHSLLGRLGFFMGMNVEHCHKCWLRTVANKGLEGLYALWWSMCISSSSLRNMILLHLLSVQVHRFLIFLILEFLFHFFPFFFMWVIWFVGLCVFVKWTVHMICAIQDCIAYDSSYEMTVQYDGMWDDESKIEDELHILTVLHLLLISCITFQIDFYYVP